MAEEALQASLESERKTWQGKVAALETKLVAAHADVMCEREMWLVLRKDLLKAQAKYSDAQAKYSDAKHISRRMMQV